MTTSTPTKTKNVFTRITLDPVSMQAVQKIQAILPNYDLNDAVKMLLGIGVKNVDNVIPQFDSNGFNSITKTKLLIAKHELDLNAGKTFDNPQAVINYAQSLS
jgi:uncharacterized protein YukJ